MNYRNILKVYKLERELAPDDLALLNTLRGMSDAERELLAESLGPPAKVKAKPKTTRKIEKCVACNYTRRAIHHSLATHDDYHEFVASGSSGQVGASAGKSKRAESLAGKIQGAVHDLDGGVSKMRPDLCTYELDGKVCKGLAEDAIHDPAMGYSGYHEFQSAESAQAATGD